MPSFFTVMASPAFMSRSVRGSWGSVRGWGGVTCTRAYTHTHTAFAVLPDRVLKSKRMVWFRFVLTLPTSSPEPGMQTFGK